MANVRRAYGNWKSQNLIGWEKALHEYAIRPIQQFAYSKGKNASDMAMVVDAMDLMYARNLDGFAIVSSDADFTPLVMRLRSESLRVYGFGEKQTPDPFVKACSTFLYLETLGLPGNAAEPSAAAKPKTSQALRDDIQLVHLLRSAVESVREDDGWSRLAAVGSHIGNQTSFDSRNYGYQKLSSLIEATELFEVRRDHQIVWIRDRARAKAPAPATAAKAGKTPKA